MDIVERLRNGRLHEWHGGKSSVPNDAANEIKRLREENNDLKSALRNVLFAENSHVKVTEFTKEKE